MKVGIGKAAEILGVHPATLRRWEEAGLIEVERTPTNRRRYDTEKLQSMATNQLQSDLPVLAYACVSSCDQKKDLETQVALLESFCAANGWEYEVLAEFGSGLNYNKRGLQKLIKHVCDKDIRRLVIVHKDRLLRFGSEIIFSLCENFGVEVVVINKGEAVSFEEELVQDVLEIITVFSARLYGSRSHKNKKLVKALKEAAEAIDDNPEGV